jgi:outer membrane lipoprotein carrier protein
MQRLAARLRENESEHLHTNIEATRPGHPVRLNCVTRLPALLVLCALPALADSALDTLLRKVEARYNRAQSLKIDFSETFAGMHRPVQKDAGVLFLRKPGRMRWDYSTPAGKVFLSDGKNVYLYVPGDQTAQKSKLKESEDMRAPLAFLLGKLDFAKDFKSFEMRPEGQDTWIVAQPKSANLVYTKVEFLAAPSGEIRQVRVTGQDQSKLEFNFSNEQFNAPVSPALFTFRPPPGVQIVETEQ